MNFKTQKKDIFCCTLFIVFWLIPILFTGITNKDIAYVPRTLSYMHRIGFLFTTGQTFWENFYIQGQLENNASWITLREEDYFQLKPFGHRTRLNQILIPSVHYDIGFEKAKTSYIRRQEELAEWVGRKYMQINQEGPKLKAVRFVVGISKLEDFESVSGHWVKPSLESFPEDRISVISTHQI